MADDEVTSDASPVPSPAESVVSEAGSVISEAGSVVSEAGSTASSCFSSESDADSVCAGSGGRKRRLDVTDDDSNQTKRGCPQQRTTAMPKATHRSPVDARLQSEFASAVSSGDFAALSRLLRAHSEALDVNRFGSDGRTPLQHFCARGHLPSVRLLVQYGADANMRTREGWSTLHMATFAGNPDLLAFLLTRDSNE